MYVLHLCSCWLYLQNQAGISLPAQKYIAKYLLRDWKVPLLLQKYDQGPDEKQQSGKGKDKEEEKDRTKSASKSKEKEKENEREKKKLERPKPVYKDDSPGNVFKTV